MKEIKYFNYNLLVFFLQYYFYKEIEMEDLIQPVFFYFYLLVL